MIVARDFGSPPIFWRTGQKPQISQFDVVAFLARATARHGRTIVNGVNSVPPGHILDTCSGDAFLQRNNTFLTPVNCQSSPKELARSAKTLVQRAIERIVDDGRKVGLLFSGGLDSTILATTFAKLGATFTCYVVEHEGTTPGLDTHYALRVAKDLSLPLSRVCVPTAALLAAANLAVEIWHYPLVCWVTANHLAAAQRMVEDGCDILVSGIGSDELFGGYDRFGEYAWRFELLARERGTKWTWDVLVGRQTRIRQYLLYTGLSSPFSRRTLSRLFPDCDVSAAIEQDVVETLSDLHSICPDATYDALMTQLDIEHRVSEVLIAELSMISDSIGIKSVFPYLTADLIRLAMATPLEFKYRFDASPELACRAPGKAIDKYLLRLAFQDSIPEYVQARRRRTYTIPVVRWLAREWRSTARSEILDASIWDAIGARRDVLDALTLRRQGHSQWTAPHQFWLLHQLSKWWARGGADQLAHSAMNCGALKDSRNDVCSSSTLQ